MHHRKLYRSVPLSISAPSSLLVKRVNESRASKAVTERAIDAPPESSDESDGDDRNRKTAEESEQSQDKDDISDVSDDEPRGSIQSSTFGSSRNGKTTNRPSTQSTSRSQSKRPGLLVSLRSREDSPASASSSPSTRGTKRVRDEGSRTASSASSTTKKVDLSATSIEFGGRAKPRQGYGRSLSSQGGQGGQGQSSQRAVFKPPPAELTETDDAPHKSKRAESTAKFKKSKYADSDDEGSTSTVTSTVTSKSARTSASTSTSKAKAKPAKASFKVSKYASSDDERGRASKDTKGKKSKDDNDGKEDGKENKDETEKKEKKLFMKSNIYGQRKKDSDDSDDKSKEAAPRAVFKMPEFNAAALGPDVAFDDDLLESLSQEKPSADEPPPQPVCPLCKTVVEIETVEALLPGHYLLKNKSRGVKLSQLKFDEKVMFCAGHKQRASRQVWTARGYPSIDWALLPGRLDTHFSHVKDVLIQRESTFRTEYERQTTKAMDAAVPGYYGRRGQQVLAAAILQHAQLSAVLRQQAVEDTVVSARGMVSYVQAVLVPELAVQLIREDMGGAGKVSAAAGRQILAESAAIGEQVMEEERDVVAEESEDESDGSVYGGQYSD